MKVQQITSTSISVHENISWGTLAILPMERLSKLFGSQARLKMLRLFVFNPETNMTRAEISKRTTLSPLIVRNEVQDLLAAGLIRKKGTGLHTQFQTNARFEHLPELNIFIRETASIHSKEIVATLKRAGNLRLVALSGHFTGILESQIDLLVVGDTLDERVLARAVHTLEAELGREIRYAAFPTKDFRYRMGVYDRLLRDVFDYPHRLLIEKIGL